MRCQAVWDGKHCNGDGISRLIARPATPIAGCMPKIGAKEFFICDECWPLAKQLIR